MLRYVISYPKSGRTWIRLFMKLYFELLEEELPSILYVHDENNALKRWEKLGITDKDVKRILLRRQPCDVMVSYYFHLYFRSDEAKRKNKLGLLDISSFIRHKKYGIESYKNWTTYWLGYTGDQLIIEYEMLFENIWSEILTYFELPVNIDAVNKIHEDCKFDNIRNNLEQFRGFNERWRYWAMEKRRVSTPTPKNPESHKFRKGKVGGYVDYLSPEDIQYIEKEWEK